jgi:hypothetical protein
VQTVARELYVEVFVGVGRNVILQIVCCESIPYLTLLTFRDIVSPHFFVPYKSYISRSCQHCFFDGLWNKLYPIHTELINSPIHFAHTKPVQVTNVISWRNMILCLLMMMIWGSSYLLEALIGCLMGMLSFVVRDYCSSLF